jgi:hypothetical protein
MNIGAVVRELDVITAVEPRQTEEPAPAPAPRPREEKEPVSP